MKTKILSLKIAILLFIGLHARASCYVSPLPDLQCVTSGSDLTNLGWTPNYDQRILLYTSTDVQDSSLGCMRFGQLMQAECKLSEPIQVTYYPNPKDLTQREITFVAKGEDQLNKLSNLSQRFKDYFAGALRDTQALEVTEKVSRKVISPHSIEIVLNFLKKPVGQSMRFLSTCAPAGAIVNDGRFMAACTRDSKGQGRVELLRIDDGCKDCIDQVEALLGRFTYGGAAISDDDPALSATRAEDSYTDIDMPLLSQYSGYLPLALGATAEEVMSYSGPVAATMAMIALKARSSPYTVLGNALDLPGCSHNFNGKFYGDCSLKTARVAEYMDWDKAMSTAKDGIPKFDPYSYLSTITNRGYAVRSTATVNARFMYNVLTHTADVRCEDPNICKNLPWYKVPAQNTTVENLSTIPARSLKPITSTGFQFTSSSSPTATNEAARHMIVPKSVDSPFPLDARKTWVLTIAPFFFYRNVSHALAVSGITKSNITVNDPHGLRYVLTPGSCNALVAAERTFSGGSITSEFLSSKARLKGDVYRFVRSRYVMTKVNLDKPTGGVQQVGTCLSHHSGASDLFKNSDFWVVTGYWNALPWGPGAKWDQASLNEKGRIMINPNKADKSKKAIAPSTESNIAEQTNDTRAPAFRDPDTVDRCRSNILDVTSKVADQEYQVRSTEPVSVLKDGITRHLCEKFEVRDLKRNSVIANLRYGRVNVACSDGQIELRNLDCSPTKQQVQPISNGQAIRYYDEESKSFPSAYTIQSCRDNWAVSLEKNSCVCEQSNANNRVEWAGDKASCIVICNSGFSPRLESNGKYTCAANAAVQLTALNDHTCRFRNAGGQTIDGVVRNSACYAP